VDMSLAVDIVDWQLSVRQFQARFHIALSLCDIHCVTKTLNFGAILFQELSIKQIRIFVLLDVYTSTVR